jgi:hypothetical protein
VIFVRIEINDPQLLGLDELKICGPGWQCDPERDGKRRREAAELPPP